MRASQKRYLRQFNIVLAPEWGRFMNAPFASLSLSRLVPDRGLRQALLQIKSVFLTTFREIFKA